MREYCWIFRQSIPSPIVEHFGHQIHTTMAMAGETTAGGELIPSSAILMAASKHIAARCRPENKAFIDCKRADPNPEKCLDKGRDVTTCVFSLLKDLHGKCTKEMDAYSGCMYYYGNEFEFCRKEQEQFEKACPLAE